MGQIHVTIDNFCTFDNPVTCCRESWHNGKLLMSTSFNFICSVQGYMYSRLPNPGEIIGRISALDPKYIQYVRWIERRIK